MNQNELMNKLEVILEDAQAAVLATTDDTGQSHLRWITPMILKGHPRVFFTFTRPNTRKIRDLQSHPNVEWMFQTRALTEIINVRGRIDVVDNPALKNEIIETLGHRLTMFWKVDLENTDFVVLETVIKEAVYYEPMTGRKETITF